MGLSKVLAVCAFVVASWTVVVGCAGSVAPAPSRGTGSSGDGAGSGGGASGGGSVSGAGGGSGGSGSISGSGLAVLPGTDVDASPPYSSGTSVSVIRPGGAGKVDLLFMIDNSSSMGDKQELLAAAVPDMLNRLVSPNCVDKAGSPTGATASPTGVCPLGSVPEFSPVHDMHIGIVTSSLGGRGGDICNATDTNPANAALNAHNDDRGELVNRGGASEASVPDANPSHLLAWFPDVPQNTGAARPPTPPIAAVGMRRQVGTLIGDFTEMVIGVHEHGCGFEAQNEAWYRFLVQPDPFDSIAINANRASLVGFDDTILRQRADFLRPDSLLAVIVVTDENEEVANPLAIGGQGWAFASTNFPGNLTNNTAPQGTIECNNVDPNNVLATGPNDPNCTSCAFIQGQPDFATRCPKDGASAVAGYLDPSNDQINVRFFNQKQRFGLFAGYPTSRYVRGLTRLTVPDRAHEVDGSGNYVGDQNATANCVNPIFAKALPTSSSDPAALCNLQRGPREATDVYYAAIAGVPHQLLQAKPGDAECPAGTNPADCPQKKTLGTADWTLITGNDPEHYDFTGVDFHMLESTAERTSRGVMANASTCPATAADNCDPINGREWATGKGDLQFACIFKLPTPKDCTSPAFAGACDCSAGSATAGTPLCQSGGVGPGGHGTAQVYGKAYPSVREMVIARAMKEQGIVSSLCPIHETEQRLDDPLYGYRPAVSAIIDRVKFSLMSRCFPQKLARDASGRVPCNALVTLPAGDCSGVGLSTPDPSAVGPLRKSQHEAWVAAGGPLSASVDPSTLPTCVLTQLSQNLNPASFDASASCAASSDPGWCYVEGGGSACPQLLVFSAAQPPPGALVTLQCL
ncbi:MAG: hypothetical protein M3O50_13095 [Myxococcota bacterium]|nr:hypothetical protein [Myxococcota bacterium]